MRTAFLFKLAALALWRSWRPTVVVSSMIIMAVGALVFILALAIGTSDAMIRNSTGLYAGHVIGSGLTESDASKLMQAGVKRVLLRWHQPMLLRSAKGIETVDLIGVQPERERETAAYWKKTVQGDYLKSGEATIFLSEAIGNRLRVKLGDSINLINAQGAPTKTLKIVGMYKTGISALDNGVAFAPVEALPKGERQLGVAVFLEAGAPLESIARQYKIALPDARFTTWAEFMPDLKQLIDLNDFCMDILIFLVFAIVAVGVSCTFLIFTLKNLREHGIMKAMGFTSRDTTLLLLMQIGLLTLIAATLGTVVGALIALAFSSVGIDISSYISHNQYFAVSGILYPRVTSLAILAPPLVAFLFSLLAAVWPVVYVLRRNPAAILRSV